MLVFAAAAVGAQNGTSVGRRDSRVRLTATRNCWMASNWNRKYLNVSIKILVIHTWNYRAWSTLKMKKIYKLVHSFEKRCPLLRYNFYPTRGRCRRIFSCFEKKLLSIPYKFNEEVEKFVVSNTRFSFFSKTKASTEKIEWAQMKRAYVTLIV